MAMPIGDEDMTMRWLKWAGLGLVVLLGLAGAAVFTYAWLVQPQVDGRWQVQGPRAEVRIERDAHGVPSIHAGSMEDAVFGLGVVHAQDRLWQMETHRRIGAGRLSEAFGVAALENDRFLRALGVRRSAAAQWARASAQTRAMLTAYTAGVNVVIQQKLRAPPPEFVVLGLTVEPWDPVDSLAWAIMMAWDLGGNWNSELHRLRLSAQLEVPRINELLPPYPGEAPLSTTDYPALYRELGVHQGATRQAWWDLPQLAPASGVEGVGSNNWAVSGARSQTGKPMLANDPHLGLSAPALWYFARVYAPGWEVAGATMPGLPVVVLGQNARLAWGFTNTGPDVQDLYIERVDGSDPSRYHTPEGSAAFERFEEVIRVRGQSDEKLTVRATRHGPVISDALTLKDVTNERHVLALRWTALDADVDVVAAGLAMAQAGDLQAFVAASQGWVAPMQNMAVADAQGRIGIVSAGRVPVRGPDHDLRGLAPAPGWDARYDWVGWVPAHETPRDLDPVRGVVASANQRVHDSGYPHFISSDWSLPYRQQRIEQLLADKDKHSLDDLAAMQSDVKSLAALKLLPYLQKARSAHPLAGAVAQEMAQFDGTMRADRASPLVFWAWQRSLARAVFTDEVGVELFEKAFAGRTFQDALEGVLERNDTWWCDDKRTPEMETCAQQVDRALSVALDELATRFGPDLTQWRWGEAHQMHAEHRPFSKVAWLSRGFHLQTPMPGDTHTINALRVSLGGPSASRYRTTHGPSLRAVYDVRDRSRSQVMHSSGQSGLPWSALYRNFLSLWAQGQYIPLWPSPEEARRAGTLLISPVVLPAKS